MCVCLSLRSFFFFNDTATTEIYTLSLHDALPISSLWYSIPISLVIGTLLGIVAFSYQQTIHAYPSGGGAYIVAKANIDRKSTRLNSSHLVISYAVFCLKKKNTDLTLIVMSEKIHE